MDGGHGPPLDSAAAGGGPGAAGHKMGRMQPSTFDAVATVLAEKFHVDPLLAQPQSTLDQLGLDSLGLMEFVFAVEDRFDIRIPEERLDARQAGITLEHLAGLVDEAVAAKTASDAAAG
jgi:acyl carrier protein